MSTEAIQLPSRLHSDIRYSQSMIRHERCHGGRQPMAYEKSSFRRASKKLWTAEILVPRRQTWCCVIVVVVVVVVVPSVVLIVNRKVGVGFIRH